MKRVIGLAGKLQSGKDTLGEHLISKNYFRRAFADRLKSGLSAILGVSVAYINEHKEAVHPLLGVTYRSMLQTLGTEWGRDKVNKDIWNLLLKQEIESYPDNIVVTDVRFPNEVRAIKELGGVIINIERQSRELDDGDGHASENSLDSIHFDYVLDNNSTIEHLYQMFDELEKKLYD